MFNLLKMDLRRLFRSRGFYIVLVVTAVFLVTLVILVSSIANPETLDAMQSQGGEVSASDYRMGEEIRGMSQLEFAYECLSNGFLLIMAGIGVTLFVSSDFSSGFIKNISFARPRRLEYVLSKILLAGVYTGFLALLGVLLSLVCPLFFGLRPAASPVVRILEYTFWNWLICWAFSLMGLALVTLTRNATVSLILAVFSGGGVIAQLLGLLCQALRWPDLRRYLLWSVASAQCVPMPAMDQIAMILGCSIGWAALYAAGSVLAMEKQDI